MLKTILNLLQDDRIKCNCKKHKITNFIRDLKNLIIDYGFDKSKIDIFPMIIKKESYRLLKFEENNDCYNKKEHCEKEMMRKVSDRLRNGLNDFFGYE